MRLTGGTSVRARRARSATATARALANLRCAQATRRPLNITPIVALLLLAATEAQHSSGRQLAATPSVASHVFNFSAASPALVDVGSNAVPSTVTPATAGAHTPTTGRAAVSGEFSCSVTASFAKVAAQWVQARLTQQRQ